MSGTEVSGWLRGGRFFRIWDRSRDFFNVPPMTEEGIPITVIYISNLPNHITRHNLLQIFHHFGKVVDCYIRFDTTKKYFPLFAFITFSNFQEAINAQLSHIQIESKKLKISPADSWHQNRNRKNRTHPKHSTFKAENAASKTSQEKKNVSRNNNSHSTEMYENILTILNEDCLLKILSYLPLHELIRSERICKRWQYFVDQKLQRTHKLKTKEWDCCIPLKTSVLQKLFIKFGRFLKILHLNQEWSIFNDRTPYLIGKYCPNLIELVVVSLDSKQWRGVISKCTKLKSLTFESCSDINDNTFQLCKANLEELIVRDTHHPLGKFLKNPNLHNLKKLYMVGICVKEKIVLENLSNLKELQHLSLDESSVSQYFVNHILKLLPKLKHLSLSYLDMECKSLDSIAELKQLEDLHLHMNNGVSDCLIEKICKGCPKLTLLDVSVKHSARNWQREPSDKAFPYIWKLKNLEALNVSALNISNAAFLLLGKNNNGANLRELICRHNSNITESIIVHIVTSCPQIKKIDVFNCGNIRKDFANELGEIIQSLPQPRSLQLNMSAVDALESLFCPVNNLHKPYLSVTYERFETVFLFGSSDITEDFSDSDFSDENYLFNFSAESLSGDDDSIFD
ncbi:uncharacterized protein LOC143920073 isoform X3 [Arctopsyche grandis]|uniref:uncharacterized protein LOC143920073 isoform X3 n=2 Tax=Arctopsyche grandis TaxID=121162 RepID=UPI00406D9CBD